MCLIFNHSLLYPYLKMTKGQALWRPAVRSALYDCQAVCHCSFSNTSFLRVRLMALYALTTHKAPSKHSDSSFSFYFARSNFFIKEQRSCDNHNFTLYSPLFTLHSPLCRTAAQNDKKPGTLRIPG